MSADHPVNQQLADRLLQILDERERLRALCNADLVREALESKASEYLVVEEMMNRLDPDWEKRANCPPLP